jgi:hypothetical protein
MAGCELGKLRRNVPELMDLAALHGDPRKDLAHRFAEGRVAIKHDQGGAARSGRAGTPPRHPCSRGGRDRIGQRSPAAPDTPY